MTRLLVSVRNVDEACAALAGGADVIDVKEPSRGALGAADRQIWQEVVRAVHGRAPVSVALGELRDFDPAAFRGTSLQCFAGIRWAKLGLAGCGSVPDWYERWQAATATLPDDVQSVAVAYADWQIANAPPLDAVVKYAACSGAPVLLVDTYDKSAGHLFDYLPIAALQSLAAKTRSLNIRLALAGSLKREVISRLTDVRVDYIAVRGAACQRGRESSVCEQLVRQLSSEVKRMNALPKIVETANA